MVPRIPVPSVRRKKRARSARAPEAMAPPITGHSGCRKRNRRSKKTTWDGLCPEVAAEILSRFTPRTVIQLQLVSKSWRSLIQTQLFPRWLPNTMLGFFYHPHRVCHLAKTPAIPRGRPLFHETVRAGGENHGVRAPILGFLPRRINFKVVDCCNGLLLSGRCTSRGKRKGCYFVCNPTTKRMHRVILPKSGDQKFHAYLAFDPHVSPHYKVLLVKNRSPSSQFWIYSSETGMVGPGRILQGLRVSSVRARPHGTYCDGALYVATHRRIIRFDLHEESFLVIEFPHGAKQPGLKASLGILGGRVCYAELRGLWLRAWTLGKHDDAYEWTLKYEVGIKGIGALRARRGRSRCMPHILAFHPHSEAVLFLVKSRVILYDLNSTASEVVCKLGSEEYEVLTATGFPFSPCSIDVLDIRRTKTEKRRRCITI